MNFFKYKNNKNKSGFSLMEMLVYIGVLGLVLVVIVKMLVSFTGSYRDLMALRVVEHSAIDSLERMTRDVRGATSIDMANSVFDASATSTTKLTLISTNGTQSTTTKFYIVGKEIRMDVNSVFAGPLTRSGATVKSLVFTALSSGNTSAVKIDMDIEGVSGTVTREKTYHATVILKGQ